MRAFWSPKPGRPRKPGQQLAAGPRVVPHLRGVAAVRLDDHRCQRLDPRRHRARVAVHDGRPRHHGGQGLGVHRGQAGGIEPLDAEPLGEPLGPGERALHRELLVQQHAHEEGERVGAQQRIGGRLLGKAQGGRGGHRAGWHGASVRAGAIRP